MKIMTMNTNEVIGSDDKVALEPQTIDLQQVGGNTYKAIVPLDLKRKMQSTGEALETACTTNVTVTSETTRNGKARRRIMLKVSTDYKALSLDAAQTSVIDERRSGAEMTAHLVISLPKAAEDDLKGINGLDCRRAAAGQVALLIRLLAGALGPSYTQTSVAKVIGGLNGDGTEVPLATAAYVDTATVVDRRAGQGQTPHFYLLGRAGSVVAEPTMEKIQAFNQLGFAVNWDQSEMMGDPQFELQNPANAMNNLEDPITRGLNGLAPLGPQSVLYVNNYSFAQNPLKEIA